MSAQEFIYGDYKYAYTLVYQKRKTLSLTVRPDMTLLLKCPNQTEDEKIDTFLKKKWPV